MQVRTVFCCVCVNESSVKKQGSPRRGPKSGKRVAGARGGREKGGGGAYHVKLDLLCSRCRVSLVAGGEKEGFSIPAPLLGHSPRRNFNGGLALYTEGAHHVDVCAEKDRRRERAEGGVLRKELCARAMRILRK